MVEVASSRQAQEAQAMVIMAKRYPRDETAAIERIKVACKRKGLAKKAAFDYVRGGTPIKGLTIRLAEVLAQCWGNIDFGIVELDQRDGESDVMSFCCDLETNARSQKVFTVKHERYKKGGDVRQLSDPRDVYEHVANYGSRRLRACIEAVIPGDIQDLALEECKKTLEGKNPEPLIDRIRSMVGAFAEFGVNQQAIEQRLGYKVEACDVFALEALRDIYKSMKDGASQRQQWFELDTDTSELDQRVAERRESAGDDSQVDPAVDKAEGKDEPSPEPSPESESDIEEAGQAKKISRVRAAGLESLREIVRNNPLLTEPAIGRLLDMLNVREEYLTKGKVQQGEMSDGEATATEAGQ
jgi:hypothetical protein